MARTKKKELQKVKEAEAKCNHRPDDRPSLDCLPNNNNIEQTWNKPESSDNISFSHDLPSCSQTSTNCGDHGKASTGCDEAVKIHPEINLASLTLHTSSSDTVPIVVLDRGQSEHMNTERSSPPILRKSSSMPTSPSAKLSPTKLSKRKSLSPRLSPRRIAQSPQNRKRSPRKNPKSPKNIFEKFESETDSQAESDSGVPSASCSPKDKSKKRNRNMEMSFDVSALRKLTGTKSKSDSKNDVSQVATTTGAKSERSPKCAEKQKVSPRASPKAKEAEIPSKKRIRSPKLLTDDMILLPLVDHRKARTSSKSDKIKTQSSPVIETIESQITSAVRSLDFTEDSLPTPKDDQNKNENNNCSMSEICVKSDIPMGSCEIEEKVSLSASATNSSMKRLLDSAKRRNKQKNHQLLQLIQRISKQLQSSSQFTNLDKDSKGNESDSSIELTLKEIENDESSDGTLPAVDSPEADLAAAAAPCEKKDIKSDCVNVDEPSSSAQRAPINYLLTKFIGNYVIPKPCDDSLSVIGQSSTVLPCNKQPETPSIQVDTEINKGIESTFVPVETPCSTSVTTIDSCDKLGGSSRDAVNNILRSLSIRNTPPLDADEPILIDEKCIEESSDQPSSSNIDFIKIYKDSPKGKRYGTTSNNHENELSPRSKKIQETKEPLPISILSRHEKKQSPTKTSAFFSIELEDFLSDHKNRVIGKDMESLDISLSTTASPVDKTEQKNDYELYEPDFDEIDGALFLSFATEEALQAHVSVEAKTKWDKDTNTFLGISRILEIQKNELNESHDSIETSTPNSAGKLKTLRGQHMRWRKYQRMLHKELEAIFHPDKEEKSLAFPEKTKDITKIKGWKKKYMDQSNPVYGSKGKKKKNQTATLSDNYFQEYNNYWSDNEEPIVLNSSGSEVEYDEDDEDLPMVAEYTEALVPPLPEIPLMSRLARKIFVKKMGYSEEDELIILKLGGRRINRIIGKLGKDDSMMAAEDDDATKEKVKKKRIRRRRQDLSLALSEIMVADALDAFQLPNNDDREDTCDVELLDEDEEEVVVVGIGKDRTKSVSIDEQEVVEVQVKPVDDADIKYLEDGNCVSSQQDDVNESDNKPVCDKPGCRYSCICHLCNLTSLLEPEINDQPTVCEKEYCRLGCICDSLGHNVPAPKKLPHCGKTKCMLECVCEKEKLCSATIEKRLSVELEEGEIPPPPISSQVPIIPNNKERIKKGRRSKTPVTLENSSKKRRKSKNNDKPVEPEQFTTEVEEIENGDGKSKRQKKRTERFSNLPKRESTYRVAKNLDAVNRKAMMVYSVSEVYSEQKTRKRKSQVAEDGTTDISPSGKGNGPEVVIERDDVDENEFAEFTFKPVKKRSRKESLEPRLDDGEISTLETMQESVEEAGCELRKVLTMDLPLGSSKLHAQLRPQPPLTSTSAQDFTSAVNLDGPKTAIKEELLNLNLSDKEKHRLELERQLLKEQLLQKQPTGFHKAGQNFSAEQGVDISARRVSDRKWHTQMVCLKPNPRLGADAENGKETEDEIKLLEFIANCNWDTAKPQILSKVAQCLRPRVYPSTRRMLVGDFLVEILPRADRPPLIPPELKTKLPNMMYSIRIKVTCREEFYQQVMKTQSAVTSQPAIAKSCSPATISCSKPILSVPVPVLSNHHSSPFPTAISTTPCSISSSAGGISAFSRLQISQPGHNMISRSLSHEGIRSSNFSQCSSEVVDLTLDEGEINHELVITKKKKRKNKPDKLNQHEVSRKKKKLKKNKQKSTERPEKSSLPLSTTGGQAPLLGTLKVLQVAGASAPLLKLVTAPGITSNPGSTKDLIAVPIQISPQLNPTITAALKTGRATTPKNLAVPRKPRQFIGKNPSPPTSPIDFSVPKLSAENNGYKSHNDSKDALCQGSDVTKDGKQVGTKKDSAKNKRSKPKTKLLSPCPHGCKEQHNSEDEYVEIEELLDEDSRWSACSENSSLHSSGNDTFLDLAEDDEDTARDMSKYAKMKRERRRRLELSALFVKLKSVVFPNQTCGNEVVQKFRVLNQAQQLIHSELEVESSLKQSLKLEEEKNRKLQETILDIMESMWEEGITQDSITEAVELTDQNIPARLVGRVIDSLQEYSSVRKLQKTMDKEYSLKKSNAEKTKKAKNSKVNKDIKSGNGEILASLLQPVNPAPQCGSMILATLAKLSENSEKQTSDVPENENEQVVDLVSDESVVSVISSRSQSPLEGVDVHQVTEHEDEDRVVNSLNISQSISPLVGNISKSPDSNVKCDGQDKEDNLQTNGSKFVDESSLALSEFATDNDIQNSCSQQIQSDTNVQNCHPQQNKEKRDEETEIESDTDLKQKQSLDDDKTLCVQSSVLDDENVNNPCDLLDLIDKSLPGNLELYEDISVDSADDSDNTISAKVKTNSVRKCGLVAAVAGYTDISNDKCDVTTETNSSKSICDSVPCLNKTEVNSDTMFNLNNAKTPLTTLNINQSDASALIPCNVEHVSNSSNTQGANFVDCSFDVPVLKIT
ncbi:uncharacterized protein LOC126831151 [Patella vulgata]|uniref:uncharacterized protein LOC126831151 n=1 Tax=Patella vulgata TaxID=6465 RepID=UPI0024A9AA48|nr:uncharacterized protein LOC126831151 [Patella vulgata]